MSGNLDAQLFFDKKENFTHSDQFSLKSLPQNRQILSSDMA